MPSSDSRVLKYNPKTFDMEMPKEAKVFLSDTQTKELSKDFTLDEIVKGRTKVAEQEAVNFAALIETKALEKLKEIQETAYQQAFDLGKEEGKKQAYAAMAAQIDEGLSQLTQLVNSIGKLKEDMMAQNETHIVKLLYHVASRLAQAKIDSEPELILNIVRSAVGLSQDEEKVVLQVSPVHFEFLESLKKETAREFEFLKNIKIESTQGVAPGGCVVETNYGEIDARLEVRVAQLWAELAQHLHRVKNRISAA